MTKVLDEIDYELNWMRLILDVWNPKTPRPLAQELRRRVLVLKGLVSDGRNSSQIIKPMAKSQHGR